MPALVVIHGSNRGAFFNIPSAKELVLGRDDTLLAQIDDPGVSRKHVEFIRHDDGSCFAVDLRSRNGIRINGEKMDHSCEVKDGDIVQMGHTLLVFVNKELDQTSPVETFLQACERLYPEYLEKLREHDKRMAAINSEAEEIESNKTGAFSFGSMFGRKSPA
ncbi:MAG: FHA domain-containing protein [Planctomycetota bacterium]